MLNMMRFCALPYSSSGSTSAVSVVPTPEEPASMKTPIGLLGLSNSARLVRMRLAIISVAWACAMMRCARCSPTFSHF